MKQDEICDYFCQGEQLTLTVCVNWYNIGSTSRIFIKSCPVTYRPSFGATISSVQSRAWIDNLIQLIVERKE